MSDTLIAPRLTPAVRTVVKAASAIGKLQAKHDASLASRGVGSISEDITVTAISSESVVSVLYKPRGPVDESYELDDTERKRIRELVSKALANPIWRKSNSALAKLWNDGREKRRFAAVLEHLQHLQDEADEGDFFEAILGVFEILLSSERDMLVEHPPLVGIPFRIVDSDHHAPVAEAVEAAAPPIMEAKSVLLAMETIWVLFDRPPQSPLYRLCLPSSVLQNANFIPKFLSVPQKAIDESRIAEVWALAFVKAASTEELGKCVREQDGISTICDYLCSPSQPQTFTASMILTYTFFLLFGSNSSSPIISAAMNPTATFPSIPILPRLMSSTAVLPAVLLVQLVKTRVGRGRLRESTSFLSTVWRKIPEMARLVMNLNDDSTIARDHLLYVLRCFSVGFVGLIYCGIVSADEKATGNELVISRLHLAFCDSLLAVEDADVHYLASVALLLMLESRLIAFQAAKDDPSGFWTGSPALAQQFYSKNMLFLDSKRFEAKVVAVSQRVALALVRGFTQIQQAYEPSDKVILHPHPLKLFLTALGRCFPMRGRQGITPCHTLLWFARKEHGYELDEGDVSGVLDMLDNFIALTKSSILKGSPNDHLAILVMATLWELCRRGWSRKCIEHDMAVKALSVAWLYSQQRKGFSEPTAWCLGVVWAFMYQTGGRRAFARFEYSDGLIAAVLRLFRSGPALSILLNLCMIVLHKNPREKQHQNFGVEIVEPLLDIIKPVTKEEPVAPEIRRLALKLLRTLVDRSRAHEEELVRLNTSMLEVYIAILRENPDPVLLEYVCHRIATMAIKSANRQLLFAMGGTASLLKLWASTDLASTVNEGTPAVDDQLAATKRSAFSLLLNAVLNVSMESADNQMLICRNGLDILHRLLVDVTNSGGDEETFAEGIMVNLKRCPSNRSILYNAQLDSAILHARMGDSESARMERAKDDKHGRRKRQHAFRKTALKPMRKRWHVADNADAGIGEPEYFDDEDERSYDDDDDDEGVNTMYGSFLWKPIVHRSGAKIQQNSLGRAETAVTLSIPKSASSPGEDMSRFKFSLNVPDAILATQDLSLKDKAAPLATLKEPDVDKDKQRKILAEVAASGGNKFASKLKQSSSERRLNQLLDEHELIYGPSAGTGSSSELGKMACWRAGPANSFSDKLFGPRLQLDNSTDVYVYHQEIDGSGAIAPKQLQDDDILGSIPCPDDLGIGTIPSFNQSAFFPLEESPYALRGSLSRFYFKSAVDKLEAGLRADFEGMNLTSALHDTSNDDDHFTLDIDVDLTTEDNGDDGDGESAKDASPPWDSSCSVFEPRVREADARSMMDTAVCYRRAFRSDWDKCMKKEDRFLNIIKKGCTDPKDKAVVRTAQIMEEYYDRIIQCFVTYCCVADATNCSWMTFGAFAAFVGDAEIPDEDSSSCRLSDIDTVFKATDFDSTRGKAGNPGKSLTRSEFAESLIRISKAKFGGRNIDAHMTIERLLKHVLSRVGEAADDFRSEWRPRVLYTQPIDDVLRKYMDALDRIFYERDERDFWSLDTWEDTLADAEMYEDSFTRHEGNMTFYFGKMVVVDTEKHAERYQGLDWLAFLEALVHVARLKEFPTRKRLEELECGDIVDYALRIRSEGLIWVDLLTGESTPPPSAATTPLENFAFQLDCCLHMYCFFLDKKFGTNDERVTEFGSIMDRR